MKYRIISDTHFWHELLIDIGDRKKWFEDKIFKYLMEIPKEDTLIHLWDILIGWDTYWHKKYIEPLQCKKILVKGNHDRKTTARYNNHWWDFVCDSLTLKIYSKEILFTHIPTQETMEWATRIENRLVIHWHYHTYRRIPKRIPNHILYSCEYNNMQAVTLLNLINKPKISCN